MTGNGHTKARQIKAARALLDWSQENLAEATHLSVATIRKLELGDLPSRHATMETIRAVMESNGLEFVEPGGVRYRPEGVAIYEGGEGMAAFHDDIRQTAKHGNCEILLVGAPDVFLPHEPVAEGQKKPLARCILAEGTPTPENMAFVECRRVSRHYIDPAPFCIYGDKYAMATFEAGSPPKIIVLQSAVLTRTFQRQFQSMWEKAAPDRAEAGKGTGKAG